MLSQNSLNAKLLEAVSKGETELVQELLEEGADANADDGRNYALGIAGRSPNGNADTVKALLEYGAKTNGTTQAKIIPPLITAAHQSDDDRIRLIIEHGGDLNTLHKRTPGLTPFQELVRWAPLDVLKLAYSKGGNINMKTSKQGYTPLHLAAANGRLEVIKWLLQLGASTSALSNENETPLDLAIKLFGQPFFEENPTVPHAKNLKETIEYLKSINADMAEKQKTTENLSLLKKIFDFLSPSKAATIKTGTSIDSSAIRHDSPYEELETYRSEKQIDQEFIDKWVKPFYSLNYGDSEKVLDAYRNVGSELTEEIILTLLGDPNWRMRKVGAIFAAFQNELSVEDIIGVHLLKSERCYAGYGYSIALASFATESSIDYLTKYLDYYLEQKDLWYDQNVVMAALNWIDKKNGTSEMARYMERWDNFVAGKPRWNLDETIDRFNTVMKTIVLINQSDEDQ